MSKTICIKTNNTNITNYLLDQLETIDISDIYFSCYKFKLYTNIIIHYVGANIPAFLNKVSSILSYVITNYYESKIIQTIINMNYFYFPTIDKKKIYNICLTNIDYSYSISMLQLISNEFYKYFSENKYVILDGFINFKLINYIKELGTFIDMCVNKYIIDKEYNEFISLLQSYIQDSPCLSDTIHLLYLDHESKLFDSSYKEIKYNLDFFSSKYVSDISFSYNDFALNTLLTLLPRKLYIHLLSKEDEFIITIKQIFKDRFFICDHCSFCNKYKQHVLNKESHEYI